MEQALRAVGQGPGLVLSGVVVVGELRPRVLARSCFCQRGAVFLGANRI